MQNLFLQHHHAIVISAGLRTRSALATVVYRKALRAASAPSGGATLVALQSIDANAINLVLWFIHYLWAAPLQIAVGMTLLYGQLGWSAILGLVVLIALIPVQGVIGSMTSRLTAKTMACVDDRVRLVTEAIVGMRWIKLSAQGSMLRDRIDAARDTELAGKRRVAYLSGANSAIFAIGPLLSAVVMLVVFASTSSEPLTPSRAFTSITLVSMLRMGLMTFPMIIMTLATGRASLVRIATFLASPDVAEYRDFRVQGDATEAELRSATLATAGGAVTLLRDVTLAIPSRQLTMVVGPIGGGKTSLLSALAGELSLQSGSVHIRGGAAGTPPAIGYCMQSAWLRSVPLKDNIVFVAPWNASRYTSVIRACALEADIASLPDGDATRIGDRGVTLSGGQRARVALARALYSDAQFLLLDDVLSAVDASVGAHIFNHALRGPLAEGRTIVLATHALQYARHADTLVVMAAGRVEAAGPAKALLRAAVDGTGSSTLRALMAERGKLDAALADAEDGAAAATPSAKSDVAATDDASKSLSPAIDEPQKPDASLTPQLSEEERFTGAVPLSIYGKYLGSFGGLTLAGATLSLLAAGGAAVAADVWLAAWSDAAGSAEPRTGWRSWPLAVWMGVYGALGGAAALAAVGQSIAWAIGGVRASRALHGSMLSALFASPMSFYDVTPAGRILNRLTGDVDVIDGALPTAMAAFASTLVGRLIGTLVLEAVALPYSIPGALAVGALFLSLQSSYRASAREIKRLEALAKSPVHAHTTETLGGLSTIRALQVGKAFAADNEALVDASMEATVALNLLNRWLGLRLDSTGALFVLVVLLAVVLAAAFSTTVTDPSIAGLTVAYALQLTSILNWAVRQYADAETAASSVERVLYYGALPGEASGGSPAPKGWPSSGAVSVSGLSARYRPGLPLVLRGVNFEIGARQRVAIVGRTGAGKSSLIATLLRLVEPSDGRVLIDGVDVAGLSLDALRTGVAVIPQDSCLFSTTMRRNLDPSESASDEELWRILHRVGVAAAVETAGGLDAAVRGGGADGFSAGQRQQLCIARALLRKPHLLLCDEATSATDVVSDAALQELFRTELPQTTVITIAHRLESVLDSDRVIVMEHGVVAEVGEPSILLQDPRSLFAALVRDARSGGGGGTLP